METSRLNTHETENTIRKWQITSKHVRAHCMTGTVKEIRKYLKNEKNGLCLNSRAVEITDCVDGFTLVVCCGKTTSSFGYLG